MQSLRTFSGKSIALVILTALACSPAIARGLARVGTLDAASVSAWNAFRKAQPFQTQVIAVAPATKAAPGTVIFSEPPPTLSWARLQELLLPISSGCGIFEWRIMAGGYVRDVVCTLKAQGTPELTEVLAQIQRDAFGAVAVPNVVLPAPARKMTAHSLDAEFSASDLYGWVTNPGQKYRASPIAPAVELKDLLQQKASGVFWNDARTLVVWTLKRDRLLSAADTAAIRRFAAGSDLILGAVADNTTVVVVGRARKESLAHLPPLRAETIFLLAASEEQELAQSYMRNDLIAGKSSDGVDRAPILLSPQLVDTEFGNLLNIADQLLKGWSQANKVTYRHFPYPVPRSFPFATPAALVEKDRPSFLFNWNTDGIAYRQAIDELDVVVPVRTGSLSIIYGDPKKRPQQMEATAYDYFARSGDTTLARVLQYTTLYMIFRQFDIKADPPRISNRYAIFSRNLNQATTRILAYIADELEGQAGRKLLEKFWSERLQSLSKPGEGAGRFADIQKHAQVEWTRTLGRQIRERNENSAGVYFQRLARISDATRRAFAPTPSSLLSGPAAEANLGMIEALTDSPEGGVIRILTEALGIWSTLSPPAQSDDSWNVTAYVVESVPGDEMKNSVGGHNIGAPLVRFEQSGSQAAGEITVSRDGAGNILVRHSGADSGKLGTISRAVGTNKGLGVAGMKAATHEALEKLPAKAAVGIEKLATITRKTEEFTQLGGRKASSMARAATKLERQTLAQLHRARPESIVVERLASGAFVLTRTGSAEAIEVDSMTALYDALGSGLLRSAGGSGSVNVLLKGVSGEKAEAIMAFTQSNLRRYPMETVEHLLTAGGSEVPLAVRPRLVNAKIANNGVRIDRAKISVSKISSGNFAGFTKVTVPITIQAKAKESIYLSLVFFIKSFSENVKERLVAAVERSLSLLGGETSLAQVNTMLKRELAADLKELNIDALLVRKDGDATGRVNEIILGARIPPDEPFLGCGRAVHDTHHGRCVVRA